MLTRQRLLYASLASSAFLIYLDPQHGTNSARTLVISHLMAAIIGFIAFVCIGSGYFSGGCAMVIYDHINDCLRCRPSSCCVNFIKSSQFCLTCGE
ncbi:HPP family protein [Chroococcus sp. FPU101]|uniref:HPP family protein n=1 Tax=Chroococcus sp. FPU101 TaxID=1974212 RepID=UPI0035ABE17D